MSKSQAATGFTLVETMLIMAIIALLFGITSILLSRLIPRANLVSTTETLIAELRNQQLKAMASDDYGVYLETNQYTLFTGNTFDQNSPDNLVTPLTSAITLSTNFANQSVVFSRSNGEILNFDPNARTITITDTLTGDTRDISLNLYGIPE